MANLVEVGCLYRTIRMVSVVIWLAVEVSQGLAGQCLFLPVYSCELCCQQPSSCLSVGVCSCCFAGLGVPVAAAGSSLLWALRSLPGCE